MILLAILALTGAFWLVGVLRTPINRTNLEREHNARVLAEAKRALLGYVATVAADTSELYPGRLPCPEHGWYIGNSDKEGIAGPSVGVPSPGWGSSDCSMVGRLPWRTLGLDKLRDAVGEPLWYVVTLAPNGWAYENTDISHPHPRLSINSNKDGGLTVNGAKVVAAIIAPGRALNINPIGLQAPGCAPHNQNRSAFGPNYYQEFLECHDFVTGTLVTDVVNNATNPAFDDQLVTITAAEVMGAIEGVIAARIQKSIVPQLRSVYATADWGASAADPRFPFAVPFGDPGSSTFKGEVDTYEGFLPLTAQTSGCSATGQLPFDQSRCDTNFVQWSKPTFTVVQTGGTATSFSRNCNASTTSQIVCTVSYSRLLCLLCGISVDITVQGDALNVGRALRTYVAPGSPPSVVAAAPGSAGAFSLTKALQSDAAYRISYSGTLSGGSFGICGTLLSLLCSGGATITIPLPSFTDHPLLNATPSDDWYWFVQNRWYDVVYYSVSPRHAPGGAGSCAGANCITVTQVAPVAGWTDRQAVLVLAGRSLAGTSGSNRALSDFLDTTENRNQDTTFDQHRVSKGFNDRFVSLSP